MSFIRWPSIENSYREKFIGEALEEFPELETCTYIVTEKLHGANMQVFFKSEQPMRVGSRKRFLEPGSRFYKIWDILPEYQHVWDGISYYRTAYASLKDTSIRLFGELFGSKVQKGVDYTPSQEIVGKQYLHFFGVMWDDELMPPITLDWYATALGFFDLLVPKVAIVKGLDAALAIDIEFPTKLNPVEGNICEGVVIQPYNKVYRLSSGSTFLLKKKNEAFKEKVSAPKPKAPIDSEVLRLHIMFEEYITDSRLQGVFSKEGSIQEPKQIGDYIRLMIQDALEDFLKDHGAAWAVMNKGQQGQVTKVGRTVAKMLQGYL